MANTSEALGMIETKGLVGSVEAADAMVKIEATLEPDMENHKTYMEMYKTWRKIYDAELGLSDAGVTNYMWAAPGVHKTGGSL